MSSAREKTVSNIVITAAFVTANSSGIKASLRMDMNKRCSMAW